MYLSYPRVHAKTKSKKPGDCAVSVHGGTREEGGEHSALLPCRCRGRSHTAASCLACPPASQLRAAGRARIVLYNYSSSVASSRRAWNSANLLREQNTNKVGDINIQIKATDPNFGSELRLILGAKFEFPSRPRRHSPSRSQ